MQARKLTNTYQSSSPLAENVKRQHIDATNIGSRNDGINVQGDHEIYTQYYRLVSCSGNGNCNCATPTLGLSRDDLDIERADGEAERAPCIEVVCGSDCTAGTLVLSDAPVLMERGRSLNRRLVCARALIDVVHRAVRRDCAFIREAGSRVVCP
jgi:hypothetical protein